MREEELQIKDYVSRPARYANIDGSNELTWGAMLCVFAASDWLHAAVPRESVWHRPWAQMVYMLVPLLLIYVAGKAFKRYVTYPRTGFVAYPETVRCRMAPLVAAAIAAVTAMVAAAAVRKGFRLPSLVGATNLVFYAVAARPLHTWKYGFLLLIAAGTLWVEDGYALLFFGVAFLASGATTLTLYLRQTRAAQ